MNTKTKSCHKKRAAHWCIVTSLLLLSLKQRLVEVISFTLSKSLYSRSVLLKHANICVVLLNLFEKDLQDQTPDTRQLSFLFVPIAMLSRYQSPVKRKSRKARSNFTHKVN
jgi:hypothetical protein